MAWSNAAVAGADLIFEGDNLVFRMAFYTQPQRQGVKVLTVENISTAGIASVMKDVGVAAFSQLTGQACQVGCVGEAVEEVRHLFAVGVVDGE